MASITINLDKLFDLNDKFTPNHYAYCYLVATGNSTLRTKLTDRFEDNEYDEEATIIWDLIDAKYLIFTGNIYSCTINPDIKHLFVRSEDEMWEEFKNAYPTRSPNGKRNLRSGMAVAKQKYTRVVVGNPMLHNDIVAALKRDVIDRTNNNNLDFMPAISTYVSQKLWEDYMDQEDIKEEKPAFNFLN